MADDDPSPPPKPDPVRPSAAWLAEQRAKNAAYDRRRARYTEAWHRRLAGLEDEPEPEETGSAPADPQPAARKRRSRARGKIHDPRQRDLDFDA